MNTAPTLRLFDKEPDTMDFEALVLSCEAAGAGFHVVLDRTAFFPEGGGQGADHGTLGEARVLDAQEKGGVITHLTDAPLTPGRTVSGRVDPLRRLSNSQQHTGEHILSGIIHGLFGYENVGFHIGAEGVTVDVGGLLTEEDLRRVERLANECVWRDVPVKAWVPSPEELAGLEYRSKKAIDGDLRIVQIPGADTCACCGTHVASTGRVGQIRIVSAIHYKGGMRLSILCGLRALEWEWAQQEENRALSRTLSAKPGRLAGAVERLMGERDALRERLTALALERLRADALAQAGQPVRLAVTEGLEGAGLPKAASLLAEGARFGLALLPRPEGGWRFALCGAEDVRPAARRLCERFGGRGGGSAAMAQGQLEGGDPDDLRRALEAPEGGAL